MAPASCDTCTSASSAARTTCATWCCVPTGTERETPCVEVPFGDFFGLGQERPRFFSSLLVTGQPRAILGVFGTYGFNSYFPDAVCEGRAIHTLTNEGAGSRRCGVVSHRVRAHEAHFPRISAASTRSVDIARTRHASVGPTASTRRCTTPSTTPATDELRRRWTPQGTAA